MRWGTPRKIRRTEYKEWHPHFAWFPTDTNEGQTVWLEWLERKFAGLHENKSCMYEYRIPQVNKP